MCTGALQNDSKYFWKKTADFIAELVKGDPLDNESKMISNIKFVYMPFSFSPR